MSANIAAFHGKSCTQNLNLASDFWPDFVHVQYKISKNNFIYIVIVKIFTF